MVEIGSMAIWDWAGEHQSSWARRLPPHSMNVSDRPSVVLVADDQPDAVDLLRAIIEARAEAGQVMVRTATNGAQALDLAIKDPPGLVILDILMPGLDGITAAFAIRRICPSVVLIGMSSSREAVADATASGTFDAVFNKPCEIRELAPYLKVLCH